MQETEAVYAFYSYMEGMFMHFKYLHASLFVFLFVRSVVNACFSCSIR